MPGTPEEDQFLEEVIGLFALEGQEWVTQIDQARKELAASPPADRAEKQWEAIRRALTNIGGSAATVELTAVERVALALLAVAEALQRRESPAGSAQWAVFSEGTERLGAVLGELAEKKAGSFPDLEALCQKLGEAVRAPAAAAPEPAVPSGAADAGQLVEALVALQQEAQRKPQAGHHLVERVLQAVQNGHSPMGEEARSIVMRTVQELEGKDRTFFEQAEQRIPRMMQELGEFQSMGQENLPSEERTGRLLEDIQSLKDAAAAAGATAMAVFCTGLETFITVAARRRLAIAPQRFETVAARLGEMRRWAFDWMEAARTESSAIQHLLSL